MDEGNPVLGIGQRVSRSACALGVGPSTGTLAAQGALATRRLLFDRGEEGMWLDEALFYLAAGLAMASPFLSWAIVTAVMARLRAAVPRRYGQRGRWRRR